MIPDEFWFCVLMFDGLCTCLVQFPLFVRLFLVCVWRLLVGGAFVYFVVSVFDWTDRVDVLWVCVVMVCCVWGLCVY